jgi:hypothetical protein
MPRDCRPPAVDKQLFSGRDAFVGAHPPAHHGGSSMRALLHQPGLASVLNVVGVLLERDRRQAHPAWLRLLAIAELRSKIQRREFPAPGPLGAQVSP